jgi:hypothetical protein
VEIMDFLKAARRRLLLIILLPVLSMAVTETLLLTQPTAYSGTAIVDAPALVGGLDSQYTGAQGVNQFVSAFEATASGPVVRHAVLDATGVSPTVLADGLDVSQRGTSSSLSVVYTSTKKDTIVPVLTGVTTTTLRALFESQVQSAKARVGSAQTTLTEATSAIGALTTKYGMADPQKAYEAQLSRVNSLVQQQASFTASGNAVGAAAMASPIASAKAELAKFGPILTEYSALTIARDTAVQGVDEANAKLSANTAQLANADPSKIVSISGASAVDRLPELLQTSASVGAAASFLALVLVLVLELVARGRATRRTETDQIAGDGLAARHPRPADGTAVAARVVAAGDDASSKAPVPARVNGKTGPLEHSPAPLTPSAETRS